VPTSTANTQRPIDSSVVQLIRAQEAASRVELARTLDIAPSTVGIHADGLIARGVLRETQPASRSRGRPPTLLELNPHAGQFIGVDLDARAMFATSVDFAQQPLHHCSDLLRYDDSADAVVRRMKSLITDVTDRSRPLLGIGIAVPGTVDVDRGLGVHYEYIPSWRDVPLVEQFSNHFSVPVFLENNIRTIAIAEQCFGRCGQISDFICVGIRSGIGSGIVIDGELYRGPGGLAGEIGGWPCSAEGEATTLESVASVRSILEQLTRAVRNKKPTSLKLYRNRVTLDALLEAAHAGDPLTLNVLNRSAAAVGRVVAQMAVLLNPRMIVIAGPLAEAGDVYLLPLHETVERLLSTVHAEMPAIELSTLGERVGATGAAALALKSWNPACEEGNNQ
jgi:predicted NBD/HSP70 family sugar kinase